MLLLVVDRLMVVVEVMETVAENAHRTHLLRLELTGECMLKATTRHKKTCKRAQKIQESTPQGHDEDRDETLVNRTRGRFPNE